MLLVALWFLGKTGWITLFPVQNNNSFKLIAQGPRFIELNQNCPQIMEQAHRRAARKSFFIATPKLMRFFIIIVKWVKCVILCLTRLQFQTDVRWVASKD